MPAAVRYRPSVAPVDWVGRIGVPGHISFETCLIGPMISGVSGGGGPAGLGVPSAVTVTLGSPAAWIRAWRTLSTDWPGKMRQFTMALARWGRALSAWPPMIMVATQVVREDECQPASRETTASALATVGSFSRALMASPISPGRCMAISGEKPRLGSLERKGQ